MQKILISVPDNLAVRMRATLPARQRSSIIVHLIEAEVEKREHYLFECASEVEKDKVLRDEMDEWDITLGDGIENEKR
jgi:hypothetical protein